MLRPVGHLGQNFFFQIRKMSCQHGFLYSWIPCVCLIPENSTLFSLFIPQEVTEATGFLSFPVETSFTAWSPSQVRPFPDRVNSF